MKSVKKKLSFAWNAAQEAVVDPLVETLGPSVSRAANSVSSTLEPFTTPVSAALSSATKSVYDTLYPLPAKPVGHGTIYKGFPFNLIYPEARLNYKNDQGQDLQQNEVLSYFMMNQRYRDFLCNGFLRADSSSNPISEPDTSFLAEIGKYTEIHKRAIPGVLLEKFVVCALNFYEEAPLATDLIVIFGLRTKYDDTIIRLYDSSTVGGEPRGRLKETLMQVYKSGNTETVMAATHNSQSLLYKALELHRYPISLPALTGKPPATLTKVTDELRNSENKNKLASNMT